jgi:hypothetical protein
VPLTRELIALGFFLANRQQANTRARHTERNARVDAPHHAELEQMLRPALDIRA